MVGWLHTPDYDLDEAGQLARELIDGVPPARLLKLARKLAELEVEQNRRELDDTQRALEFVTDVLAGSLLMEAALNLDDDTARPQHRATTGESGNITPALQMSLSLPLKLWRATQTPPGGRGAAKVIPRLASLAPSATRRPFRAGTVDR